MAARRFTEIEVSKHVYVSSDGHHHFDVHFKEAGQRKSYRWWFGSSYLVRKGTGGGLPTRDVPQYVRDALKAETVRHFRNGDFRFYEYNQEGEKRYANLRYHDAERFAWLIGERQEETT